MDEAEEQSLNGGVTEGVVRVGDTVRRPPHRQSGFVRSVLKHLHDVGFDGAPRMLGVDTSGREIFTYLVGDVIHNALTLSDAQCISAAHLIRRFHDATVGTPLTQGAEIVMHGDLGPHNTVFDGDQAVGLIDWDEYVMPGPRIHDVGHAVWCFADIGERGGPLAQQARRARLFCDAYGWDQTDLVIDEIADRFRRAREHHARAGNKESIVVFDGLGAWMAAHGPELKSLIRHSHR